LLITCNKLGGKGVKTNAEMAFSSVVWTLIDNGKLANQIAKLAAIVLQFSFFLANHFKETVEHTQWCD